MIQKCVDLHILPAIFAFTPIKGTRLQNRPQPSVQTYRRIQLARYLITKNLNSSAKIGFDEEGRIKDFSMKKNALKQIIETGLPFLTSGCPDCNRPFYNEKLSGPIYNYPKTPTAEAITDIKFQLNL
jgi:biotin synthase-related radical SAM superfamily protein